MGSIVLWDNHYWKVHHFTRVVVETGKRESWRNSFRRKTRMNKDFMVQNIDDTITHEAMCFLAPSYLSSLTQLCSPVIHWGPAILAFFLAPQSLTPTLSRTCPHPIFFCWECYFIPIVFTRPTFSDSLSHKSYFLKEPFSDFHKVTFLCYAIL